MKKILILGAARSGIGVAKLAYSLHEKIIIYDDKELEVDKKVELEKLGAEIFEKEFDLNLLDQVQLVVKSPGIYVDHWLVEKCLERNIPVIGEIEYASRYTSAILIGITGSNGKTTTTSLTYHILKEAGLNVAVAGNIGNSFAEAVMNFKPDYFILEISNLQLLDIQSVHFDYACITNITPDHLDVHKTMDHYVKTKFSIVKNSKENDWLFCNYKDRESFAYLQKNKLDLKIGDFLDILYKYTAPKSFVGNHNQENIAAAATIAEKLGISAKKIQKAIDSFKGVRHRIEFVAERDGVKFYNDSKATNIDSAKVALDSFESSIIWICGGVDKGNNYEEIKDLVLKKVKKIICLTKYPDKIVSEFSKDIPVVVTENIGEAVKLARENAVDGDIVLLSPACASFDLFKNFEDRGEKFCEAVRTTL